MSSNSIKQWSYLKIFCSPIHYSIKRYKNLSSKKKIQILLLVASSKLFLYLLYKFLYLVHRTSPTPLSLGDRSIDYTARFARRAYHILPLKFQFWMRDSGFMRQFMDFGSYLSGIIAGITKPSLFIEYLRTNDHIQNIRYGLLKRHTLDVFDITTTNNSSSYYYYYYYYIFFFIY